MTHVLSLTLTQLMAAIQRRDLSPVDVTRAFLGRIAEMDPPLGACAQVWEESALHLARASEQRVMSGLALGPLEGVPLFIKDVMHVRGRRTDCGSTVHADRTVPTQSATVVNRLLDAGAIPLGKAKLPELAVGGWGVHRAAGTPRNPWDSREHRVPGGSSSGCAVAVSAGMAAGSIGTDASGCVRVPAALCGLTGLKPSQGRVSHHGVELLSPTLDTIGPMARSAEDVARLLQAIHGPDPHDPLTLGLPPEDFVSRLLDGVRGVRFTVMEPGVWGGVGEEIVEGIAQACETLEFLDCKRTRSWPLKIDLGTDDEQADLLMRAESYLRHGAAVARCETAGDPVSRERIMSGRGIGSMAYAEALARRRLRAQEADRLFKATDVLVLPTVPVVAPLLDEIHPADESHSRFTRFVGYFGLCAIALPCGHTAAGLPLSVQFVAAAGQESLLLRLGAAFQSLTAHHLKRPRQAEPA